MQTEELRPGAGDYIATQSGRPVGRVLRVEENRLIVSDRAHNELAVPLERVSLHVGDTYALDCEEDELRWLIPRFDTKAS